MISRLQKTSSITVVAILVFMALISLLGSARFHFNTGETNWSSWWDGALQNFSTEMMGALVAFILFDQIIEARKRREDKQEALDNEIDSLIHQMQSDDPAIATIGYKQASSKLMFQNRSLEGKLMIGVNLQGQSLIGAKLRGTTLIGSHLEGATLWQAELQDAIFTQAHLQDAKMKGANLQGADLYGTKLQGANLTGVNLADTNIQNAECNEETILPDGTKWTSDVDWSKF